MTRRWSAAVSLAAASLGVASCHKPASPSPIPLRVAAASDLTFAFKELGSLYEKKTGRSVTFSFGSTGLLAKQIEQGAPFDLFAAANLSFVDDVVRTGDCEGPSRRTYARGIIVMFAPNGPAPASIEELADPKYKKIAIANPDHAPYGKAAKQALVKAGIWDQVKDRMVYGENVQQTLQFAQSANADIAIVALSLAKVSQGSFTPIDPKLHDPLDQALVVCKRGGAHDDAQAFSDLVSSEQGRSILRRYGFMLPGEALADTQPGTIGNAVKPGR